jgi:hypothetical protein
VVEAMFDTNQRISYAFVFAVNFSLSRIENRQNCRYFGKHHILKPAFEQNLLEGFRTSLKPRV